MNRKALGLIMPLATTGLTILIIISVGTLLLEVRSYAESAHMEHTMVTLLPVIVALAGAGAILIGCSLAARGGRPEHPPH